MGLGALSNAPADSCFPKTIVLPLPSRKLQASSCPLPSSPPTLPSSPNKPSQAKADPSDFEAGLIFEQDPVQIVDALLPLYLNSTLLRSLQEALASELAARMNAMSSASDNAAELRKGLNQVYNRKRQAKITTELSEIVAGASSV